MISSVLLARRRVAEIDAELPNFLRMSAACLSVGMPFEEAIACAADCSPNFGKEISRSLREVEIGASVPCALSSLSARSGSLAAKRAACALSRCYSGEDGPPALKLLAGELSRSQKSALKEHAARSSMLGMAFISSACVLPSLFLSLAVAGSAAFGEILPAGWLWLFFAGVLPGILLAIIALAWISAPAFSGSQAQRGRPLLGALSPFAYLSSRRARRAERYLPQALLHASTLGEFAGFEEALASLSRSGYGELGEEFARASKSVSAGEPFPSAILRVGERLSSPLVSRACVLLAKAYGTGAELTGAMREAADDAVESFLAEKEKAALLALQRYTLLAGVLLVPVILGFVSGAASSLDFSSAGGLGLGGSAQIARDAALASALYILVFSCLSGAFLAVQEGEPGKSAAYALAFAPAALAAFILASGGLPG